MAIKRIPRNFKTFEFDGEKFALRPAKTEEVMQVTRIVTKFQRSLRTDIAEDQKAGIAEYGAGSGDPTLMIEAQEYVALTLVVDFETHEKLFGESEGQENIKEAPGGFILAAWLCYSSQDQYIRAMDIVEKLGVEFEPIVRDIAIIDRRSLVVALGAKDYKESQIQDFLNILDGKVAMKTAPEGKKDGDPTTTVATTTSSFDVRS